MKDSAITLRSRVSQAPDSISSNIGEQLALMSIASGKYVGLDDIGRRIWELIARPTDVSAVCAALLAEYGVERGQCERDLLAFLAKLAESGLVLVIDE